MVNKRRLVGMLAGVTFTAIGSLVLYGPVRDMISMRKEIDRKYSSHEKTITNEHYLKAKREYEGKQNSLGLIGVVGALPLSIGLIGFMHGLSKDDGVDYYDPW